MTLLSPAPPLGLLCGECPGLAAWLQEASLTRDWGEGGSTVPTWPPLTGRTPSFSPQG